MQRRRHRRRGQPTRLPGRRPSRATPAHAPPAHRWHTAGWHDCRPPPAAPTWGRSGRPSHPQLPSSCAAWWHRRPPAAAGCRPACRRCAGRGGGAAGRAAGERGARQGGGRSGACTCRREWKFSGHPPSRRADPQQRTSQAPTTPASQPASRAIDEPASRALSSPEDEERLLQHRADGLAGLGAHHINRGCRRGSGGRRGGHQNASGTKAHRRAGGTANTSVRTERQGAGSSRRPALQVRGTRRKAPLQVPSTAAHPCPWCGSHRPAQYTPSPPPA